LAAPRVVGLWACGTQRGPAQLGDDTTSHLGSAFLEANECSVLVSRADVALEPMLCMARRFARGITSGESPAEAARAARAEVADDPRTADPFFHSSIVLYGDPGRTSAPIAHASTRDHPESGALTDWRLAAACVGAAAFVAWMLLHRVRARRARD
jgi:hypothetical protein